MMRKIQHILAAATLATLLPTSMAATAQNIGSEQDSDLIAAQKKFADAIAESVRTVTSHPLYEDPENRAAGFAFLNAMTFRVIEENILIDRDYPYFSVMDFRSREGGDNPDQRYLYAPIRGGKSYRIWGRMGKDQVGMEFQIYRGYPWVEGSGGRSVATLSTADLKVAPDGTFEGRCQSDAKRSLPVKRSLTRAAPQAMRFCHSARAAERRSL